MLKPESSKTGNAPIVAQGQTTDGRNGTDPGVTREGSTTVRDLQIETSK